MDDSLKQFGTGIAANLIFVVAYLGGMCMKKRCKHSHCKACCIEFDADIEITQRGKTNPLHGERGEEGPELV